MECVTENLRLTCPLPTTSCYMLIGTALPPLYIGRYTLYTIGA